MKRKELLRHLKDYGCVQIREGAKHSRWINPADKEKQSTIPRHAEIDDFLAKAKGSEQVNFKPGLRLFS